MRIKILKLNVAPKIHEFLFRNDTTEKERLVRIREDIKDSSIIGTIEGFPLFVNGDSISRNDV